MVKSMGYVGLHWASPHGPQGLCGVRQATKRGTSVSSQAGGLPPHCRAGLLLFRPFWGQNMGDTQRTPAWASRSLRSPGSTVSPC